MLSETRKSTIGLKKVLCTVLALFMAFACLQPSFTVLAADKVGDVYLTYDEENASYYVSDCNYDASGEIIIPSEYNDIPVTSIGDEAFSYCDSLTSITIPDSVTSIGKAAFHGCTSLTSITIPDSVTIIGSYTFCNCESLTSITIPDSVTSIGGNAFEDCTSLTSIEIPDSVTSIGEYAFYSCDSLTSVTIGKGVKSIGDFAFCNCINLEDLYITDLVAWWGIDFGEYDSNPIYYAKNFYVNGDAENIVIPEGATEIPDGAFYDWDNLVSVTIPDSVTSIGSYAFSDCDSLTSITIPDSLTNIGEYAFSGCYSLASITIPDSVTYIGEAAFWGCDFTSVTVGKGVTSIGDFVFGNCANLKTVTISENVTSIGSYAFRFCDSLTSVTIPDSVTSIGENAFESCQSLTSITIPDSVTSICSDTFYGCRSLISITIPDSVTSIGSSAFGSCSSLTSITIPDSVTSMDSHVFYNCVSLTSITIPDSVTSIGGYAFYDCKSLTDVFYKGSESDWSNITIGSNNEALTDAHIHFNATDHTYSDWITDIEPTCTQSGSKHKECIVCQANLETVEIFATGHTETVDVAVEATCTETGLTEGSHCSVCNAVIKAQETVPAKSHTSSDWIIDKEATCIEVGSKHRECTVCQANLETVEIIATGHTSVKDEAVAATCTETGLTEGSHCSVCNAVIKAQETVKAKGHTKSDWKTEKKATVNAAGKKVKKCTVCGETVETGKIAQLKCSKPSLKKIENTADGVKITWGKVTGADSYAVYRKTGSGKYTKIATVKGNSKVTYTDKKAKSGKKYYYNVKAVNEAGESSASKAKSILYLADTTLSTPKSTKNGITLKWKKVTGAEGYQVWRKTGNGSFSKIATVKGNAKVTYTDKSAKKGKTYTYKIKAYKGNTTSADSNTKKIKDKF